MSKTINTTAINTAIDNALKHAHAYASCVEQLQAELRGVDRSDAQSIVTPAFAKFYGVATKAGERGITFDKTAPKFAAADKARTRLMNAVYGARNTHKVAKVVRLDKNRVAAVQSALVGLSKAEARAYFAKAMELAFA